MKAREAALDMARMPWAYAVVALLMMLLVLGAAANAAVARPGRASLAINAGAAYTNSTAVTLRLSGTGIAQMRFCNAGGSYSAWETYSSSRSWTLSSGDGTQTVTAQYKGSTGKSLTTSDTIVLDTAGPSLTGCTSSTNPLETDWYSTPAVSTAWTAAADLSGVSGYSWSLDADAATVPDTCVDGANQSTSFAGVTDGVWYFHVRAVDGAGNWGAVQQRIVRVDTTGPATSNDYDGLPAGKATIALTAAADVSGAGSTSYRLDGGAWTTGSSITLVKKVPHKRPGLAAGVHTVEYYSTDGIGNQGPMGSCEVTLE